MMTLEEKKTLVQGLFAGADLSGVRQVIGVNEGDVCYENNSDGRIVEKEAALKIVTVKVRAMLLLELMKRSGIGLDTKERTKVCRVAAMLMGCDYKALLNTVVEGIKLNKTKHGNDVELVNNMLEDLGANIRLNLG